jgi:ankyrin repeat protein
MELLLTNHAEVNAKDNEGMTPLHWAAYKGSKEIAECLLTSKADANAQDMFGRTPASMAVETAHQDLVDLLGRHGGLDLNSRLIDAAEKSDLATVNEMLAAGASLGARNDLGFMPLIIASKNGSLEMVKFLIEKGADVNAGGANGTTPLYAAAANKRTAVAEYLISAGASPEAMGPADEQKRRFTPLMCAAILGNLETVEALLANGAKIDQPGNNGDTALMVTSKTEHTDMVKFLMSKGANVNAAGPRGHTALIYAAYNGQIETVKLLLAAGADPNAGATDLDIVGRRDYDAVDVARQQNHPDVAELILQAQAKSSHKPIDH